MSGGRAGEDERVDIRSDPPSTHVGARGDRVSGHVDARTDPTPAHVDAGTDPTPAHVDARTDLTPAHVDVASGRPSDGGSGASSDGAVPAVAPGGARAPRWRSSLRVALLLAMLAFAVYAIARNRQGLVDALRELSPWTVAVSFVPAVLAMVAALFVWRSVLADLGSPLPVPAAARVFFLSQLGKYLPGAVWSIASQVELTRELKVPRRTVLATGVVSLAVSTAVGVGVAAVMLPLSAPDAARRFWWVLLAVPPLLAVLHPAVLERVLNTALRLVRRPPLPVSPTLAGLLRAAGWQLVVWLLLGVHAWMLIVALGGSPARSLPVAIGGYALAYSIGLVSLLPSGAGVREAALTVAFTAVIVAPEALVVALVSRAVLVAVDLGMAGAQFLAGRARRNR